MEVPLKEEVYSLEFKSLEIIMGLSGDKESILEEMESKDSPFLSGWACWLIISENIFAVANRHP